MKKDPVLETIEAYNQIAAEYKKRLETSNDINIMKGPLDKFISFLKGNKVLDIGTGAGYDAKYLADSGNEVISIDLSKKFLELARDVARKATLLQMDMRKMDFQSESFDGIWASSSLLHIPKNEVLDVLGNSFRCLKKGGVLFIALKQGTGEKFVVNKGENNLDGAKRFFAFYSKSEFTQYLSKAGFKILEYEEEPNRDNLWMRFYCRKD